ncbi:TetR/AcrR family transcriptional regulator [Mycobacterium sp. ACS4331]|uniref:TetR/AcrR family transcriptional regulator n=1 Tax=Mycobacterium sp. ACS4331 TaxID=1834121 RepID=UPI000A8A194D|nr:TetR/AcrR family transcriptional regulator [Mycobacterium sp. ACS4331]
MIVAAVRLVARDGLTKLTYRSLAKEANVTHGTIQHHFNSLDEVLEEALNYALEVTLPTITEVQDGSDLYGHLVDVIREKPDVQAFQMEMVLESRHRPRLAAYVKHIYRIYHHCTEASLALLGLADDEELTQLALAVGDGIIFQFIAMGPEHAPNAEAQIRGLSRLISTYAKSQIRD